MLSSRRQAREDLKSRCLFLCALFFIFCASSVFAADSSNTVSVISAGDMLKRITDQFPKLMRLVTAVAYVMGFALVLKGITKMKHLGESRTMMSQEHSVSGPIIYLFVGAALIYLPSAVQVGMLSFWSNPNPYGYVTSATSASAGIIQACFVAVQLFGTIAFIRGLLIISHMAEGRGGQGGGLGKGLTHIVGGIFCINIYQFVKMIMATIGVTISGFNG